MQFLVVCIHPVKFLLLDGAGLFFGSEVEVLPKGGRVHEEICHFVHFLDVAAVAFLGCLVADSHAHELLVDCWVVLAVVLRLVFAFDAFYFLPD